MSNKTPGQIAYEEDVRRKPNYPDGFPRKTWEQLPDYARRQWEKNPTPFFPPPESGNGDTDD